MGLSEETKNDIIEVTEYLRNEGLLYVSDDYNEIIFIINIAVAS